MERINYASVAFILFFASAFVIVLVLIPKYQMVAKIKNSLSEWEKTLEEQKEYFNKTEEDLGRLKEYQNEIGKISMALPDEPSLPSFFNLVDGLASSNGLFFKNISQFTISQSKEIPEIKEIDASFTLSGSYEAFKKFISYLETSARMVEIENISLKIELPLGKTITEAISEFIFSFKVKFYSF